LTILTHAPVKAVADYWQEQRGVTISAAVKPGEEGSLLAALTKIGIQVGTTGQPFAGSTTIHYARFVFIPGETDVDGGTIEPSLMYLADFDGSIDKHLDEINEIAATTFETIGHYCRDPVPSDPAGRRRWLAEHVISDATYYVNTIGRTVKQIRDEARLRTAIEEFLDSADLDAETPAGVADRVRQFVRSHPDLAWALDPAPSDLTWRVGRTIARISVIGVAIPAVILLLPVLVAWAIMLRRHEDADGGSPPLPDPNHVLRLAAAEDKTLQNQFSALGFVKPGWFRLTTARTLLWLGRFGTRYFFDRESIAGVTTIHFARWTFIDKRRRMLFASNYDGSLENYMGDFIDIVAWGLNAIFSNGIEYPRTRWLIIDGAWNEGAFKRHIRNRQIETQVWYCAYPNLSATNIAENARIRAELSSPPRKTPSIDWLRLLRRNWGRPADVPVHLEKDDMQGILVRGYGGHTSASFLLINFKPGNAGRDAAKQWLGRLKVADGAARPDSTIVNVAFTARGLGRLGCPAQLLVGFSDPFLAGMTTEHRRRILGDDGASAPEHWDWGGPEKAVDGVVLVYARSEDSLKTRLTEIESDLAVHDISFTKLDTKSLKVDMDGFFREHFGFSDGLTAPPIEGLSDGARDQLIKPGEFFLGYQNEYGRYTERPLVDPAQDSDGMLKNDVEGTGKRDFGRNGTYLVFRQLSQDVRGFWAAVDEAAAGQPGATPAERRIRLASKMVGRWPGGAPLVLAPDRDDPSLATKDFAFHAEDRDGLRCPVGAHIRRTNPRDSLDPQPGTPESVAVNKRHKLLRRGRTYGTPLDKSLDPEKVLAKKDDGGARGLHFICLVANITRQFEFVQASWANSPQFGGLIDDVDPLIGRRGRFTHPQPAGATASFTVPGQPARRRVHGLPDFVTVKGGAYFFMPSLSAIRFLAAQRPGQ
jgi:Dyp-type peroxidase family